MVTLHTKEMHYRCFHFYSRNLCLYSNLVSVAREKCLVAAEKVGGPFIVEDTSLCFNALNGMPGVFIKWFLDSCGRDGLFSRSRTRPRQLWWTHSRENRAGKGQA